MENKNVWNHQPVVQCLLDPQGSTKRPILPLGRIAAGLAGTQLSSISHAGLAKDQALVNFLKAEGNLRIPIHGAAEMIHGLV